MSYTAPTACPMCGETIPPEANLYCTPRCRERAKKQRQRARAAGAAVAIPKGRRRRDVTAELADHLAAQRRRPQDVSGAELAAAQRETARLAGELSAQQQESSRTRRLLDKEQQSRQRAEREARFLAIAFTRTAHAHGLTGTISPAIRARLTEWLPEQENPWH